MYAKFNADHTVKLLEAAGGDFELLKQAVQFIRKRKLVFLIKPEDVKIAVREMAPRQAA
jgi:hypothetical protein